MEVKERIEMRSQAEPRALKSSSAFVRALLEPENGSLDRFHLPEFLDIFIAFRKLQRKPQVKMGTPPPVAL